LYGSKIDEADCAIDVRLQRNMRISKLTSGERLRRKGQTQAPMKGRTFIANLIVMGASAGGQKALVEIVKDLPVDIPAAIVVLVHSRLGSEYSPKGLLEQFTRIPIVPVCSPEPLRHQTIFVLPPGKSASFHDGMIIVGDETVPDRLAATINRLFTSAAQAYRQRVIGVILSGLLKDGTAGLRAVHEAGGLTIVQDPVEAEYPSMPASAMANLPVTFCLNLSDIGAALELLVRRETQFETGLAVAVRTLRARAAVLVRLAEQSWRNPGTREFLLNELASLKCDLSSIEDLVKDVPD
jgi:two-component system chemotaxis response regulator CheB